MPNHIPWAASGAPYADWMKNVSQRNAPGAMSAMAFDVRPVRPSVDGGFELDCSGDMELLSTRGADRAHTRRAKRRRARQCKANASERQRCRSPTHRTI